MRKKFTFLLLWVCFAFTLPTNAQNLAFNFTGINYVQGNFASEIVNSNGSFTVEFWAYVPSLITDGNNHIFISEGTGGVAFYMGYNSTGQLVLGDEWTDPVAFQMPVGRWTHLAMVFSGQSSIASLYVNGAHLQDFTGGYFYEDDGTAMMLGALPSPIDEVTPTDFMSGRMDELRVWSVARTAQQIKTGMLGTTDVTDPTLVAYYNMDDGTNKLTNSETGSILLDNSIPIENADTVVATGMAANFWAPSPVQFGNNGLTFDGGLNQVVIPASSQYDLNSGTVEFWVNPTSLSGTFATVLGNRGPGGVRYSFHLSSTQIGIDNGSGSLLTLTPATPIPTGSWTHLAFVNDGSQTIVYINGVAEGTPIPGSFNSAVSGQPMTLGVANTPGAGEGAFTGGIDEVRIWSTKRQAADILSNIGNTLTGTETGLVGQFSFDQGAAGADNTGMTTALDNTVNNNHGVLTNFSLLSTSPTSNFVLHTLNDVPISLPVTLVYFTATRQNDEAVLQWETAQEQNSSNFIIERSSDGNTFGAIGNVAAAGNSNIPRNYSFTDLEPGKNNNYYRLRQTDLDGSSTYSAVRLLNFQPAGKLIWYATGPRSVEVYLQQGNAEQYSLSDLAGHTLRQGQLVNGKTDISGLPAGLYIVRVLTAVGQDMNIKILLP
jgi:Concanavalin A-like lectin/glucanases superfamily